MSDKQERLQELTSSLLETLGENPQREGLLRTPRRVARAWQDLTVGYSQSLETIVNEAVFEEDCNEIVIVRDIEFYSLCEHHLLPFFGKAHVGYIPDGRVIGLSKIPRIIDMFARRLQVQERLTHQVAQALREVLQPLGVAVVMEGAHMCMQMRGVQKQNSMTTTSAMLGEFHDHAETRAEFLSILNRQAK